MTHKAITENDLDHMNAICEATGVHNNGCSFSGIHAMRCKACDADNELAIHSRTWIPRLVTEVRRMATALGVSKSALEYVQPKFKVDSSGANPLIAAALELIATCGEDIKDSLCSKCSREGAEFSLKTREWLCEWHHPDREIKLKPCLHTAGCSRIKNCACENCRSYYETDDD